MKAYGFDDYLSYVDIEKDDFNQYVERFVSRGLKKEATRNWIRVLVEKTTQPLTLDREDPDLDIIQILGLYATSALTGGGLQKAAEVADWDHPWEERPHGSGIPKYISNRLPRTQNFTSEYAVPSINSQFDQVHDAVCQVAANLGIFKEKQSLAVDPFRIEWSGEDTRPTITRPPKFENDVTQEWTYV
ncbi:MAG: hypothetical protein ABEI86_05880, partial [Halobacteriaceae archaeon]